MAIPLLPPRELPCGRADTWGTSQAWRQEGWAPERQRLEEAGTKEEEELGRLCALGECAGPIPVGRGPRALYCAPRCKQRADYLKHGEARRAAVRAAYAAQHGSPGLARVRVPECQQCGTPLAEDRPPDTRYCNDTCKERARGAKRREARGRGPRPCRFCGGEFTPKPEERAHVTYCSEYCRNARNGRDNAAKRAETKSNWSHRRRVVVQAGVAVSARDWRRVVHRHGGRCAYCRSRPRRALTQDHVVPVSRGGRHAIGNLLPACQPCNSSKGGRLLVEWRRTRGYARRMATAA